MTRTLILSLALTFVAACDSGGATGDTDFTWTDGDPFEYDPCYDSVLVGDWADAANPGFTLITFSTECDFSFGFLTGTTAQICGGGATFSGATAPSGTVTLSSNGAACATCSYTAGASDLTLDCGVAGVPTQYVPTGS